MFAGDDGQKISQYLRFSHWMQQDQSDTTTMLEQLDVGQRVKNSLSS